MSLKAVFFDLDDTLICEGTSLAAAFEAAARLADGRVSASALQEAVIPLARELWHATPVYPYCRALGIASWEALSSDFPGDSEEMRYLRQWAPEYRRQAWSRVLAAFGIEDARLVEAMAEEFRTQRRRNHVPFDDAMPALSVLQGRYALALITNGPADLQRAKVEDAGLARCFGAVLISGELGVGKPNARIFELAASRLGVSLGEAVMIGDNPARDVEGALRAGVRSVLIRRPGSPDPDPGPPADHVIAGLTELPDLLQRLD